MTMAGSIGVSAIRHCLKDRTLVFTVHSTSRALIGVSSVMDQFPIDQSYGLPNTVGYGLRAVHNYDGCQL